jgi:hypothetical protein
LASRSSGFAARTRFLATELAILVGVEAGQAIRRTRVEFDEAQGAVAIAVQSLETFCGICAKLTEADRPIGTEAASVTTAATFPGCNCRHRDTGKHANRKQTGKAGEEDFVHFIAP